MICLMLKPVTPGTIQAKTLPRESGAPGARLDCKGWTTMTRVAEDHGRPDGSIVCNRRACQRGVRARGWVTGARDGRTPALCPNS